jgi:hypothetical protein
MHPKPIEVEPGATITVGLLPDVDRQAVFAALESLLAVPRAEWPARGVHLLRPEGPLYHLRVPPDLNVYFTADAERLVLQDIVRQAVLDRYGPRARAEQS